ncbi:uncharacterized protein ACOB8E_023641 [Sarcophilus harrisii]
MASKPILHYVNGRGRMESIRWLLAVAGVEFEEKFFETREQLQKLKETVLLFQQVPMVEIDGMKLVQTRAILHYIAEKYNLLGKDMKERAHIIMYSEGTMDLMELIMIYPFLKGEESKQRLVEIANKAKGRYFPAFENILKAHGQNFLVGNQLSMADVQLFEAILMVEEKVPDALTGFPLLQAFKTRISNIPTVKTFLAPGSKRKPMPDANSLNLPLLTYLTPHTVQEMKIPVAEAEATSQLKGPQDLQLDVSEELAWVTDNLKSWQRNPNSTTLMEEVGWIRWLLAAAGVEFEEVFLETREQYLKLQEDGYLLFHQVPLVEIDGMKLTQTRAILSYLAAKYNLYGKDLKETALINMYTDGTLDLMLLIALSYFKPAEQREKEIELVVEKAKSQYFTVFEKILKNHGQDFLVGNKFSWADIQLLEVILMIEESCPTALSNFPLLQAFKTRISNIPNIKKFLQPGSQRKPPPDDHYVATVKEILQF